MDKPYRGALSLRTWPLYIMILTVFANAGVIWLNAPRAISYALGIIFGITCLVYCGIVYRFPLGNETARFRNVRIAIFLICGMLSIAGSINNIVNIL